MCPAKRKEKKVVRPGRFELPTSCSGGKRSIQLSYGRASRLPKKPFRRPEEDKLKHVLRYHAG